ncbi:uncharacterized protein LOC129989153 [Argiope bruennichi]|uniref:Uncharacterized protein n=1 Tax=Argiope bruennichi TaxID=94029 RepID=A0A8T0EDX2_ARGBR|nr:uncharacterized protein LOC129989153 [Argiope bruennichi]KAF8770917.1 hypothetical protein HNY73_018394 [Argiope bruennichi]
MKLVLMIVLVIFILCVVTIDAKRKKDGKTDRERNVEGGEPGNGGKRKPPNHKGYKSKYPFPLFKSCQDFNVEYSMKRKELKRNREIWPEKCKVGTEDEQEKCKSEGISSIRCSLSSTPSEECMQEVNDFMNGITCDETGGGETEDDGSDIDDTTTEGIDEDLDDEDEDAEEDEFVPPQETP